MVTISGYVLFCTDGILCAATVNAHYTYYVAPSMEAKRSHRRRKVSEPPHPLHELREGFGTDATISDTTVEIDGATAGGG